MSGRSKEDDRERSRFWKNHLDQWSRSGTSQVEYSKANGLRSNRMTYWKNKFKRQTLPVEFVQIPATRISQRPLNNSVPKATVSYKNEKKMAAKKDDFLFNQLK
jgi:hypothetical protein